MALKATEQLVDTGTAAGKAFLNMFGVFVLAELESHLHRERQLERISAAKARGLYKGREPSINAAEVVRLRLEKKLGSVARYQPGERLSLPGKKGPTSRPMGMGMPIKPELRGFYPENWREISRRIRFERAAGICQGCGRPHGVTIRCLPDGRWFDPTWRDGRGGLARSR